MIYPMKKIIYFSALILSTSLIINSCTTTKVERVPREKVIDLSGSWNDSDARMVSEEMIKSCLKGKIIFQEIPPYNDRCNGIPGAGAYFGYDSWICRSQFV